jgi:hypothetical protein
MPGRRHPNRQAPASVRLPIWVSHNLLRRPAGKPTERPLKYARCDRRRCHAIVTCIEIAIAETTIRDRCPYCYSLLRAPMQVLVRGSRAMQGKTLCPPEAGYGGHGTAGETEPGPDANPGWILEASHIGPCCHALLALQWKRI